MQVIKRDQTRVDFDKNKIVNAIMKAMTNGSGIVRPRVAEAIADEIYEENKDKDEISIAEIEALVYDKLITKKQRLTARAYEGYRSVREFQRHAANTIDEDITELLNDTNEYWKDENTNKNSMLLTTKRDYIAGIVSTDLTRRNLLPPEIVQAHDEGLLHFHDADYFITRGHNCFKSDTKFYTANGVRSFSDFHDGDIVQVIDKDGVFREATVRCYGKQSMNEVVFATPQRERTVVCTANHRWLLKDGSVTTELKVGDTLIGFESNVNETSQTINQLWKVKSITPYSNGRELNAWCVEEPVTHSFMLEGGIITGNCDLINLDDMLQNGTVISGILIEKPHSFSTACTVTTQIVAQVASSQYGGQSISLTHLAPFVDISRQSIRKEVVKEFKSLDIEANDEDIDRITEERLKKEITKGLQTIQYQLITLMTTNGQAPFITIFMYLNEAKNEREKQDLAMLIEEILNQRIEGVKNEEGVFIAPAFPKLIYVLQEDNISEGTPYWYLTELAAQCSSKRLVPDYISEKIMKELKGDVYTCMGCVDGEEIITYQFGGKLYVESFKRMWTRLADCFEIKQQFKDNDDYLYIDLNGVEIYDTKNGFVNVQRLIKNKADSWVNVKLTNGRSLVCTPDHPFATERGRVRADELNDSDIIEIDSSQLSRSDWSFDTDKAWLLGFILCDGCYDSHLNSSVAYDSENDIIEAYVSRMKECFDSDVQVIERNRGNKGTYKDLYSTGNVTEICNYLYLKYEGRTKAQRHIPNEVFSWTEDAKLSFLAGMIDADGYINDSDHGNCVVQIGSTNKELALQQMALAQALGMSALIYQNHYSKTKPYALRYRVEFTPNEALLNYVVSEKKRLHFTKCNRTHTHETASVISVEPYENEDPYSYDVTTDSDYFTVSGVYSHNCRSFLTPDRFTDAGYGNIANAGNYEEGKHKYYGRFNQGVVTLNLVDIALSSERDLDKFWELFEERTELCHKALRIRHDRLEGTLTDVAPILWQYGALARLPKGSTIDELLYHGYSTISLGYAGLYECVKYMTGHSHSDGAEGEAFGLEVMQALNDKCKQWREAEDIDYSLYGTPLESATYKFAKCLKARFGEIEGITDRNYITNSYHIPVFEPIDAFEKLRIEAKFQKLSPGGAISYIETPSIVNNWQALLEVIKFMYDNILYAEINTKSCYCEKCGYDGDIPLVEDDNGKLVWECPNCGNRDASTMDIAFRTCGYIGTAKNGGNQGRYGDIHDRVYHLDDMECECE